MSTAETTPRKGHEIPSLGGIPKDGPCGTAEEVPVETSMEVSPGENHVVAGHGGAPSVPQCYRQAFHREALVENSAAVRLEKACVAAHVGLMLPVGDEGLVQIEEVGPN